VREPQEVEPREHEQVVWRVAAVDVAKATCGVPELVTGLDLGFYAARSYSLMSPPRTGLRLIRWWDSSARGWSGRGGRSWRLR
jgi:hypothetical protein